MQNKAFLGEDGLIHNVYEGNQTADTVAEMVQKTAALITQLHRKHQPANVLADLTKIKKQNVGARLASRAALRKLTYQKAASFGASSTLQHIMNFVLFSSGQGARARVFATEEKARKWLGS